MTRESPIRRVVVFCNWDRWVPQQLLEALLPLVRDHATLEIVAVCVPRPTSYSRQLLGFATRRILGFARWAIDGGGKRSVSEPPPIRLGRLARKYDFEVLVADDARITDEVERTLDELSPDILVSIYWSKFSTDFFERFQQAINYHPGAVPDYRGLHPTKWSLYRSEARSGFTVHRISEEIDRGNVLVADSVPIREEDNLLDIELAKTRLAVQRLPAVLDALADNIPGTPQTDLKKYNRFADMKNLIAIKDATLLSSDEVRHRIRALGSVCVSLKGREFWLTGLGPRAKDSRARRPVLGLSDGAWEIMPSDRFFARLKALRSVTGRATPRSGPQRS